MITVRLTEDKTLQLLSATKQFVGENKFEQISIQLPTAVCGHVLSDYNIQLHVSNTDTKEYFKYPLQIKSAKSGYIATVDVGVDLTEKAQTLKMTLYMMKGTEVGITNPVPISVEEPAIEKKEIPPRSDLLDRIAELEAETSEKSAEIERLTARVADLTAQVETLTADKAALEAEVQSLNATITALQSEVDDLKAEKAETERHIAELDEASATIEIVLQGGSL